MEPYPKGKENERTKERKVGRKEGGKEEREGGRDGQGGSEKERDLLLLFICLVMDFIALVYWMLLVLQTPCHYQNLSQPRLTNRR